MAPVTVTWTDGGARARVRHTGNGNWVSLSRAEVERAATDPAAAAALERRLTATRAYDTGRAA